MAEIQPLAIEPKKASLDRFLRDSPGNLEGADSSQKPFALCPELRIRQGSIASSESSFAGYDVLAGCGKWQCEVCGKLKLWILRKRISAGSPNKFLTLTVRRSGSESPREAFQRTSPKIRKLFDHFRKSGKSISFVRILESTAEGFPHYHFALRSPFLQQKEISRVWDKLTGSPVVDIRVIKGHTLSYISKYITKSSHVPYSRQRITFSRCWPKEDREVNRLQPCENWGCIHNDEISSYARSAEGFVADLSASVLTREFSYSSEICQGLERIKAQFSEPQTTWSEADISDFVSGAN